MVNKRAQLLLVGSVLIALAVVTSVVLLNSVYAPGDLQTDEVETDTEDITGVHDDIETALTELFERTDSRDGAAMPFLAQSQIGAFEQNVSDRLVPAYSQALADRTAGSVSVEYTGGETGWAIYQQNGTAFTNRSGDGSWVAVAEQGGTETTLTRVRLRIDRVVGSDDMAFVVNGSSGAWRLNVSASDVVVDPVASSERALCGPDATVAGAKTARVEIVGDRGYVVLQSPGKPPQRCEGFPVAPDVGSDRSVEFENGGAVRGNYTITGTGGQQLPGAPGSNPSPYPKSAEPVLVDPQFEISYVSSGVTYESMFALYDDP